MTAQTHCMHGQHRVDLEWAGSFRHPWWITSGPWTPKRSNHMPSVTAQESALSGFFSAGVYRELATKGRSPLLARLLAQSGLLSTTPGLTNVGAAFDAAFAQLMVLHMS